MCDELSACGLMRARLVAHRSQATKKAVLEVECR
jgi:hypothetical protein